MKKGILVGLGVAALLVVMWWADKKFPAPGRSAASTPGATSEAPMPSVAIKDLNDRDVTLDQYKGQVVLVNFWATWCEPCKIEIPWMIEFQKKYSPRGFTILGVSMDEEGKKAIVPFLEKERFDVNGTKEPMSYKILIGNDDAADKFGGLFGYPTSILISRDGKQIKRITGIISEDEMNKAIESQL